MLDINSRRISIFGVLLEIIRITIINLFMKPHRGGIPEMANVMMTKFKFNDFLFGVRKFDFTCGDIEIRVAVIKE